MQHLTGFSKKRDHFNRRKHTWPQCRVLVVVVTLLDMVCWRRRRRQESDGEPILKKFTWNVTDDRLAKKDNILVSIILQFNEQYKNVFKLYDWQEQLPYFKCFYATTNDEINGSLNYTPCCFTHAYIFVCGNFNYLYTL